jgi:PBSX family phage terminase large subunit
MSVAAIPSRKPIRLRYYPVGSAKAFIAARDLECLIEGPAGTGKTMAAMQKLHLTARKYPKARILMVRQTLESLKTGALNTYIKHVRPELDGVTAFGGNKFYPAEFRYPNGSVIAVGGLDKADKFMSSEFDVIFVNEGTEIPEDTWQALKTRLRNGVVPYQQLLTDCNPSGPRHWLNQRCIAGKTRRIKSTHRDNPAYWDARRNDWTQQGREYVEATLGGLTGVRRQRLLEGVWAAAEGQVYTEFNPDRHVRTTIKYPVYGIVPDGAVDITHCTTSMAVDVGSRNPTAILTAHHRDDYLHISHEVYRRGMTSSDILAAIKDEADRCHPDVIYIDPSAKAYIDDLTREKYPAAPAVNDVLVGIQRVHGVLARGFSVDPSCTNLIDEFGMYSYPDNPKIETDKPVKDNDHAMDALRYLCVGLFGDIATAITDPGDDLAAYLAAQ